MMTAFDAYVISQTITTVTRKCPFCDGDVEDSLGESNYFVAHLSSPITKHKERKEWDDYVALLSRV
jgi:hypothetical protein